MLPLLLLACPEGPSPKDSGDTAARECEEVRGEFEAEAAAIRSCERDAQCGQELVGTSCGCTRNWVARKDADTTAFYALIDEADGTCDLGLESTCDCPVAYGFACEDAVCTWSYDDGTGAYPDCRASAGADYEVGGLSLAEDTLIVTVSYAGGCETHTFTACWDGLFAESDPVQATMELFHDDGGDSCEAWITEDVHVDLAPLRDAWQLAYGAGSGTIVVNLGGFSVTYGF